MTNANLTIQYNKKRDREVAWKKRQISINLIQILSVPQVQKHLCTLHFLLVQFWRPYQRFHIVSDTVQHYGSPVSFPEIEPTHRV